MDFSRKIILLVAFIFIAALSGKADARADAHIWEFTGEDGAPIAGAWRVERGSGEIKEGSLEIKDGSFPVIYSPERLNVPSDENVFLVRLKTDKPGVANLSIYSAHTNFAYSMSFRLQASSEYRDYRVYLKDIVAGGDFIYDFALKLPGNNLDASIDSIGFYEPTPFEVVSIFWEGFWEAEPIVVGTSNKVKAPGFGSLNFVTFLYFSTPFFIFAALLILYFYSRRLTRNLVFKAVLIGFVTSALLFSIRMDFNWLAVWKSDRSTLQGKNAGERIRALNHGNYDGYFDFIDSVREIVPEGASIRPANRRVDEYSDHVARSVSYYLLPVKSAPNADYLWLYFDEIDRSVTYDPDNEQLKKGKKVIASGVRPMKYFGDEAALFKFADRERDGTAP